MPSCTYRKVLEWQWSEDYGLATVVLEPHMDEVSQT